LPWVRAEQFGQHGDGLRGQDIGDGGRGLGARGGLDEGGGVQWHGMRAGVWMHRILCRPGWSAAIGQF